MKTMKILLAVVLVAICVVGCGKSEPPRVTVESRGQEAEKKMQEKKNAIAEVSAVFTGKFAEEKTPKPDWLKEAKGEKTTPFAIAKVQYVAFLKMGHVLDYFDAKYVHSFGTLTWADTGIPEKDAKFLFRETGLILAENLMATLKLSREEREQAGQCGQGEDSLVFSDGVRVIEYIARILQEIGAEPKNIATTSADFRKYALKVHKEELDRWRRELKVRPDSADLQGLLYGAIRDAVDGWHFSPKELGLSKDEIALMKPRG